MTRKRARGRSVLYSLLHASIFSLASVMLSNQCVFKHSWRNRPLNDSAKALSVGLPGRENQIRTPLRYAQASSSLPANSDPLSTQIAFGNPYNRDALSKTSVTRLLVSEKSASKAGLTRLMLSTNVKTRNARPSASLSEMKSRLQRSLGAVASGHGTRGCQRRCKNGSSASLVLGGCPWLLPRICRF